MEFRTCFILFDNRFTSISYIKVFLPRSRSVNSKIRILISITKSGVKIRLLFSIISLRKKALQDLTPDIVQLTQVAQKDEDSWVRITAQLLSGITNTKQKIDINTIDNNEIKEMVRELEKASACLIFLILFCTFSRVRNFSEFSLFFIYFTPFYCNLFL